MANIAEKVFELVKPTAEEQGLILWDVKFLKEGASYYLRIFIDKEDGVSIDDCTNMSHAVDPMLDEADLIDKAYYLEVCSTGLERQLTRPEHYEYLKGEEIIVALYKAKDGSKTHIGILESYDGETLKIKVGEEIVEFLKAEISKVKLNDGIK